MPNQSLFSDEKNEFVPDVERPHPVVWLQRIVLLGGKSESSVIRNIELRRGLNIIQTESRSDEDEHVAGHSVGKTLLMRFIRYAQGEPTFGNEDTETRVGKAFPTGQIITQWSVDGAEWIVCRPMKKHEDDPSFCIQCSDWKLALDKSAERIELKKFLSAVSDAATKDLLKFKLPKGRIAKWPDILAWISRDYQCGYRKSNEWRHSDSESGSSLDREENSFVLQWVLGLMGKQELEYFEQHQELLRNRAKSKSSNDRELRNSETLRRILWEKMGVDPDRLPFRDGEQQAIDSPTPFKPVAEARAKIRSLRKLIKDRKQASNILALEKELEAIDGELEKAKTKLNEFETKRQTTQTHLKQKKESDKQGKGIGRYSACEADPCFMQEKFKKQKDPPPEQDDFTNQMESELTDLKTDVSTARKLVGQHQSKYDRLNDQLTSAKSKLAQTLSGIEKDIGRWETYLEDAQRFERVDAKAHGETQELSKLDRQIDESLEDQKTHRKKLKPDIDKLSSCYEHILQRIFDEEATGKIVVDGNGLSPKPDKELAPSGAALAVMTSVLAFDIASMLASIVGLGSHPRLLFHDSPREADMEQLLFSKLFEVVHYLETLYDNAEPSFQYIVTTTTSPPKELADPNGPYVCLTLDARDDNERLLRKAF